MAVIAKVDAEIREILTDPGHCEMYNVQVGEAVAPGQVLCWHTTTHMLLADGNDAALDEPWAIALQTGAAGEQITVIRKGLVEGYTVAATAVGTRLTLTDNPGEIEGGGAGECVGRVVCAPDGTRLVYVDICGCIAGIG